MLLGPPTPPQNCAIEFYYIGASIYHISYHEVFHYIISRGSIVGGIILGWCSNRKNPVKGGVPVKEKENNVNNINREVFQYIISRGSIVGGIIYDIIYNVCTTI